MALKGYIAPNTYTVIDNIIYEKVTTRCTALLQIYSDSSKTTLLASTSVIVDGTATIPSIISVKEGLSVPPKCDESTYFLIKNGEDSLYGCDHKIGLKTAKGEVYTYNLAENSFLLYAKDEDKYYLYKENTWVEQLGIVADKRVWNKWFNPTVALASGTNTTEQMYKLIKTLPLFKGCEDV